MLLSIPLAALMTLALPPQARDETAKAASVASFVGEEVAVVVHADLAKLDVQTSLKRTLGKAADDAELDGPIKAVSGWVDGLKKAGAKDLFILVDPTDMPGYPTAVVPLVGGGDAKAITAVFLGEGANVPLRWPACETIRNAVVAGTPAALARIKNAKAVDRPELAAALKAGGDAAIRVAVVPSNTQRRAVEESMPALPPQLGGGPISNLSRGMTWASLSLAFDPTPMLRFAVQGKDADSAKAIQKLLQNGLTFAAAESRDNPRVAELSGAIGAMKPELQGDKVTLEADLGKTAALVSVPLAQAREAARRTQCVNNLKQMGLAMHNYLSTYNTFPPAFTKGKDGKPLLSWRVHILPYLEQQALYKEFHLDEPWDSEHNKPLIARMPTIYACPSGKAGEGKTCYLTPRGPATIFPGAEGVKIQDVTDGTSNTLLVVETNDDAAVIWTKPDDWETAPALNLKSLFGHHPGGTEVGFADGSVRFIKDTIAAKILEALLTRNGGEVINQDDF